MDSAFVTRLRQVESLIVPVFLERFILTVLAAVSVTVMMVNPFNWDRLQQSGILIALVGLALFIGATAHRMNRPLSPIASDHPPAGPPIVAPSAKVPLQHPEQLKKTEQDQPIAEKKPERFQAMGNITQSATQEKEVDKPKKPTQPIVNAPGGVVSINQRGGITAGTVNVVHGQQITYQLEETERNTPDGDRFRTVAVIKLSGGIVPVLLIGITGQYIIEADVTPREDAGPTMLASSHGWGRPEGTYVIQITNASFGYRVVTITSAPARLNYTVQLGS